MRILKKHYGDEAPVIGSLTTLYNGFANLDSSHFWTEGCKEILLNPRNSFEVESRKLRLDINDTPPVEYLTCKSPNCGGYYKKISCLSVYYDTLECICHTLMTREADKMNAQAADVNDDIFTVRTKSLIISDDLQILPNTTGFIQTLTNLGITDVGELTVVVFGFSEIMDLLKRSLLSRTPLTDLLLHKRQMDSATIKYEPGIVFDEMEKEATSNSKKMVLKVVLQTSTNKILFAEAREDFIDFLCSLLSIPLGEVECLLGGNTCLNSMDNLYRSIADPYLVSANLKDRLLKPKLPHGYISGNPFLPLTEECFSPIKSIYSYNIPLGVKHYSVKFLRGQGKYVRGPNVYKITDDLTVTPFCMSSTLSALNGLKIPLSDVKELELEIGLEEALSILKASLSSTSALTDGLKISSLLQKQIKKER